MTAPTPETLGPSAAFWANVETKEGDVEDEEWSESPLANAIYSHVQSQFCLHPEEAAEEAGAILQILKDAGPDAILAALKPVEG